MSNRYQFKKNSSEIYFFLWKLKNFRSDTSKMELFSSFYKHSPQNLEQNLTNPTFKNQNCALLKIDQKCINYRYLYKDSKAFNQHEFSNA